MIAALPLLAVRCSTMRKRVRLRATTGKSARLLAFASVLTAMTVLPGAATAGANVAGGRLAGYRQIANLTGPNIPFFRAPPGSLVADIVFVDPALHRVYLSDQSNVKPGTNGLVVGAVDAWDTRTFKFVGAMYGGFTGLAGFPQSFDTEGPDGVLVDDLGHVWAGNGNDQVMVGDARTMKEIKVITTGGKGRADELAYDPLNQTILVTNPGASPPGWTLIDARTFQILGRATLGAGTPTGSIEQPKFDPVLGKFVSSVGQLSSHDTHGALAVVDTQVVPHTHTVHSKPYRISAKCNPLGLAIGPGSDEFLSCFNDPSSIATALPNGAGFVVEKQFTQACCSDDAPYDSARALYCA